MKVFVWQYLNSPCKSDISMQGGVVIFAESLERAMQLAKKQKIDIHERETPDDVREVYGSDGAEKVYEILIQADGG
jgi:hypothetical protein